jgi:hypothetical protein
VVFVDVDEVVDEPLVVEVEVLVVVEVLLLLLVKVVEVVVSESSVVPTVAPLTSKVSRSV